MPTYQYRCPSCDAEWDEKRSFARADEPTDCPGCGARETEKVIGCALFYAPGSAARALLALGAPTTVSPRTATRPTDHGVDCPCCRG